MAQRGTADAPVSDALPDFLAPTFSIDLRAPVLETLGSELGKIFAGSKATARKDGRLQGPFFMERQTQTNWCWATVGVALAKFLGRPPLTQCATVQRTRNPHGVDCCQTPGSNSCNVVEKMSNLLPALAIQRLASPSQPQGPLKFAIVQQDISRNRPLICAMTDGVTSHFVVIVGWAVIGGAEFVIIDDPAVGGRKERPIERFTTNFEGRRWAQTTRLQ